MEKLEKKTDRQNWLFVNFPSFPFCIRPPTISGFQVILCNRLLVHDLTRQKFIFFFCWRFPWKEGEEGRGGTRTRFIFWFIYIYIYFSYLRYELNCWNFITRHVFTWLHFSSFISTKFGKMKFFDLFRTSTWGVRSFHERPPMNFVFQVLNFRWQIRQVPILELDVSASEDFRHSSSTTCPWVGRRLKE